MAKVTAYTELTTPAAEDILMIVDDPSGTPTTKKVTVANLATALGGLTRGQVITLTKIIN